MRKYQKIYKEIEKLIGEEYQFFTIYEKGKYAIIFAKNDIADLYFMWDGTTFYSIYNDNAERFINCKIQFLNWVNGR